MALAVTVGALVKSVTGMGLPPVAIPVLALFVGPRDAIIIMTLSTIVTNAFQMWTYRDAAAEARHLPRMVAAGVVGTPVGVYFLTALDPTAVGLVLAATVFLYIGFSLWKPELSVTDEVGRRAAVPVGVAGGALQGATGLSAVILASYLHATRLPPRAFLFSVSTLFGVFALVQVAGLVAAGAYTPDLVVASVVAAVLATAVVALGTRFLPAASPRVFNRLVMGVLTLSALKLVIDALA